MSVISPDGLAYPLAQSWHEDPEYPSGQAQFSTGKGDVIISTLELMSSVVEKVETREISETWMNSMISCM